MNDESRDTPLRKRHLLDVSGAMLGEPVLDLVTLSEAAGAAIRHVEVTTTEASSTVARCVEKLRAEVEELHACDALLSFVRDGRDMFVLAVRKDAPDGAGLYAIDVPVCDGDGRVVASYDGLVLLDKVLSRLVSPPPRPEDADVAWAD